MRACLFRNHSLAVLAAFLLFLPHLALAQASFTGTILGVVTDPSGAVVAGAKVVVKNTGTNESAALTTDEFGNYFVPNLKPGAYRVEVEAQGFKRSVREGIVLQIDQRVRADFQIELGSTTEVVEVTEALPVLQTETGSLGQVVDNRKIVNLPLNGRGAFSLIALVPGVTEGTGSGTRGASARINGGRNRLNEIQLDGITAVNVSGGNVAYTPMVDALQEFKVLTNSFSAEYGRTGGGVILAAIKSGSNRFHGTVFEFLRNDALNARNFFARPQDRKPVLKENQFGAAVGGPIRKDKTFFFADWQGSRRRTAATRTSSVPTPAMRRGDLSELLGSRIGTDALGRPILRNQAYSPATQRRLPTGQTVRDPFEGNIVPRDLWDAAAARALEYYPVPNGPGLANNFVLSGPGRVRIDQADLRIDHNWGERIKLMGRHSINDNADVPSPTFPTEGNPANYPSRGRLQNSAFSYIHTFSPRVINELRLGFNRVHSRITAPTFGANFPSKLGVPNVPLDVFPRFNISGLTTIGTDRSRPNISRTASYQLVDNFTFMRGRHYFKAGFDFRRGYLNNFSPTNASGEFSFGVLQTGLPGVSNTGVALGSFLLGLGSGFQFLPGLSSYLQFPTYDFYFQDDFKFSSRLTLNFGLRYEPAFHWTEKYNRISNFSPEKQVLDFAGVDGAPRHFYPDDYNNFGPRFGLAYSLPSWKTVVRLGYGLYHASAPVASNPGTPLEAAFPWARSFALPSVPLGEPLFSLSRFPGGASTFDTTGRTAGEIVFFDRKSRAPYMQSWNLTIQRELRASLSLEAAYAGTKGTKLYTPGSNLNQVPPQLLGPPEKFGGLTSQQRRPFPDHQSIAYNTFGVSSIYHSLQMKAEQRFAGGLGFLAAYTWSKSIDNGSGLFPGDNPQIGGHSAFRLQNRYDMRGERSISADDQGHRFVLSYTYDLPWGRGRRFLNGPGPLPVILGGWQVAGITLLRSGLPFGIDTPTNTTDSQGGRQRANRVGDGRLSRSERQLNRFYDTSAFVLPPQYSFGNAARNVLRAPGRVNFDFMLGKTFPLRENVSLDFRAEFFNLMNTPPFGFPGATVGTPQFGVIGSADDPRIVQLALKLNF